MLLKKNIKYEWSDEQEEAFKTLKEKLITAPVLAYPDFSKDFFLFTDSSGTALGAILSQKDQEGREKVIHYASRNMTSAEKNYTVTEQECLAVVWSVSYFRQYLHGTRFTIVTDHSALKSLLRHQLLKGRLARWILSLQE